MLHRLHRPKILHRRHFFDEHRRHHSRHSTENDVRSQEKT